MDVHIREETLEKFVHGDSANSINRHIAKIAGQVRDRAKEKAPVAKAADENAVPGKLRDSIRATPDPDNFGSYLVGSDLDYAIYVEHGTLDTPAHPFLRPALDEIVKRA